MSDTNGKKVRYVCIGGGAIAQRRHLPEIVANPAAELVALADTHDNRAAIQAKKFKCEPYTDHVKMLAEVECDVVVVATPNALHCPQTLDAFAAGRHVLVEKPMAGSREEARKMIDAAKKAGKFLMIGMNQRLMPAHVAAKEILDTGKLGRVLAFETNFKHAGPDGWSVDGAKSWFFKPDLAVMGVCGDLGIHKADLMRYLLGDEFESVGGFVVTLDKKTPDGKPLALDDNAFLELKSKSGIIGSIHISWTNYGRLEDNGTMLFCEKGVMRVGMDPVYGVMVDYATGRKERMQVGEMATNEKQVSSGIVDMMTASVLSNTPPTINGEEGYKALNVVLTGMEAAKERTIKTIEHAA